MKKAYSVIELALVLLLITVITIVVVAKINVKNSGSTDIEGFSMLKMALNVEGTYYAENSTLSDYSKLNSLLSNIDVVNAESSGSHYISFENSGNVLGLSLKVNDSCYMVRKDYEGNLPTEVWSVANSGVCSASRALGTNLVGTRGETSTTPVVIE